MPILPLFGANHCLQLLHMSKSFIFIEETEECINDFDIGYMIRPNFHVNKSFKEQVINFMNNNFGALAQPSFF